jgi:NADPH2 dehydrogenase
MYQASNGALTPFHEHHYAARALGGVGLIIIEATAVSPEGRISDEDLGLWDDEFIDAHKNFVSKLHAYQTKVAIQLAHAGRKSVSCASPHIAPSAIAYSSDYQIPVEMSIDEIHSVQTQFVQAALRAQSAGYDGIEVHAAHGYLIHEFLSPLSNKREDEYGGSVENRARFLHEILRSIRSILKPDMFISLRVSASDYHQEGLVKEDLVELLKPSLEFIDILHVSSGGNVSVRVPQGPLYQVDFAQFFKETLNIPTIAVGLITQEEEIDAVLTQHKADLVALGRELLRSPFYVNDLYHHLDKIDELPSSYERAYKKG